LLRGPYLNSASFAMVLPFRSVRSGLETIQKMGLLTGAPERGVSMGALRYVMSSRSGVQEGPGANDLAGYVVKDMGYELGKSIPN
jgi:hypothetical protein